MQTLRQGSHAPDVRFLQRLLNQYIFTLPAATEVVDEDGDFGLRTAAALRRFQENYRGVHAPLAVDGVAGPQTWRALGLTEERVWPIMQVGQTADMSCWVVSAGMATGRNSSMAGDGVDWVTDRSAPTFGGLPLSAENMDAYARANGMRRLGALPADVAGLRAHVARGPCILAGDWIAGGSHVVVISGLFWASLYASMIRIHDPAPMGRGSVVLTDFPTIELSGGAFTPTDLIVR
jgi:Putative peptidoglycan binding domain